MTLVSFFGYMFFPLSQAGFAGTFGRISYFYHCPEMYMKHIKPVMKNVTSQQMVSDIKLHW